MYAHRSENASMRLRQFHRGFVPDCEHVFYACCAGPFNNGRAVSVKLRVV
jgi:hypothetical protein